MVIAVRHGQPPKKETEGQLRRPFFHLPTVFSPKKSQKGVKFFTFLKYAKISAYFEPKMTILRQLLTIWQPFLWLLSDMAGHLKRRRRGSCAACFFVFTLHFLQKMTKRGQDIFIFLKSAKNFAYFEPKMTILRQKLTIWQPFLWVLSDMARHLKRRRRGSCAARFFVFPLQFLQKNQKSVKYFYNFWNLQSILLNLRPKWVL